MASFTGAGLVSVFGIRQEARNVALDVRAFQVCWNDHAFYLLGGEDYYGSSSKYAEMVLNPYYALESRVASEKFLWVAAGGELQRYVVDLYGYVGPLELEGEAFEARFPTTTETGSD